MPRGWKAVALVATVLEFLLTWIHPRWPLEQAMHSSLAVAGLVWLVVHDRRWPMGTGAFAAVCLFIGVHNIAAHWLYSYVPYDQWFRTISGWSPQVAFGWRRNNFDRLIHLLYGMCFAPALAQYLRARWRPTAGATAALVVMVVMSSSLVYEWLEWAVALSLAPGEAEAYNGQQGDIWDAHMDMLLATIGALAVAVPQWLWTRPRTVADD
jgi:putative membrane protein